MYKCLKCSNECDLHDIDDGGYEEVWGAKMWHPMWTTVSDCCHDEYEEVEEEEEYDGQPDEAQEWHDFDPDC